MRVSVNIRTHLLYYNKSFIGENNLSSVGSNENQLVIYQKELLSQAALSQKT